MAKGDCLACSLTRGEPEPPGGQIFATEGWVVEHCVGPLGVGTLIVKPLRHCLSLADLTSAESAELGPLLKRVATALRELLDPVQVYCTLWSHAGWEPAHIHLVVQPIGPDAKERFAAPGPALQAAMFEAAEPLDLAAATAFAVKARATLAGG